MNCLNRYDSHYLLSTSLTFIKQNTIEFGTLKDFQRNVFRFSRTTVRATVVKSHCP
jgi:hypothetical protein